MYDEDTPTPDLTDMEAFGKMDIPQEKLNIALAAYIENEKRKSQEAKDRLNNMSLGERLAMSSSKEPQNGHDKKQKAPKVKHERKPLWQRHKINYDKFEHETDETISLQPSGILPKSDKLQFIDPHAVALPNKAIPREKFIIEQMSRPVKKSQIPYIMIGIMAIVAMIALSILYERVIEPAQEAERAYNLEVMKNGGNATGIAKPQQGSLFQFNPVNPFAGRPDG